MSDQQNYVSVRLPVEVAERLRGLVPMPHNLSQLTADLGVVTEAIRQALNQEGDEAAKDFVPPSVPQVVEAWIDRVSAGDSVEDVAEDFGVLVDHIRLAMVACDHGKGLAAQSPHQVTEDSLVTDLDKATQDEGDEGMGVVEPIESDYVCPQCGPAPEGRTVHAEQSHTWPPGSPLQVIGSPETQVPVTTKNPTKSREPSELLAAAKDALELADEGWAYASDYFREKWDFQNRYNDLAAAITNSHPQAKEKADG